MKDVLLVRRTLVLHEVVLPFYFDSVAAFELFRRNNTKYERFWLLESGDKKQGDL